MNKRLLLSLIGVMFCLIGWSITTPEDGKYYRIVNLNSEKATNVEGEKVPYAITESKVNHALTTVAQDDDSKKRYAQIWLYTGGKFQNAQTQRNILANTSKSTQFYTDLTGSTVTIENKTTYFLLNTNGGYLHSDGSNNVVVWNETSNESNHWDFEEVTVNTAILAQVQAAYQKEAEEKVVLLDIVSKASTYAPIIEGYFSDGACTTLKAAYSTMTDDAFKAQMTTDGLPSEVQTIVLRIKNKWSDELDATQSAKFRIQDYTCYPRASEAKSFTKATQISDMNNITGIWTNALQLLYIFVETDIPENASLRIAQTTGDQGRAWYDGGTELKKGLNIIYCSEDLANNWIMYTVPFSSTTPIASYPKIKIHIEGGNVIGYMNTLDADGKVLSEDECNANWKTQLVYANAILNQQGYTDLASDRIDFAVKGERGMMLFPVECYNRIWATTSYNGEYTTNYNIYKSIRFFDNVLKWEWGAMGITKRVVDGEAAPSKSHENMEGGDDIQPTYVNNLACGMMIWEGGKNPYSSDGYTSMPGVGAVESSYNAERENFDVWCVGHESGHNNQGTINLPCSMESSNNYFSNIIQYQNGYRLSRGMTFEENVAYMNDKVLFPHRSISMTLRMYFNLYLYYHRAQKNTTFSTKLHQLLRKDPMYFGGEGWWTGPDGNLQMGKATTSWLKFYEKCCDAAGEDLTEYFRLWGFFIPTGKDIANCYYNSNDGYYYAGCGDYSSYYIRATQDEINASIARVKAKKYPENRQIMFIEDRLKPQKRFDAWDPTGTDWKKTTDGGDASNEAQLKEWYGEVGYVDDYLVDNITPGEYTYTLSGTKVTLNGKGGVGFIVYNKNGEIATLSNRLTLTVPAEVLSDGFTIKVINADNTETEVQDIMVAGTDEQKKAALNTTIQSMVQYTNLMDETGTKVGYYNASDLQTLISLRSEAKKAIANNQVDQYVTLNNAINAEVVRIKTEVEPIQIKYGGIYTLQNYEFKNKGENSYLSTSPSAVADGTATTAQWSFAPAGDGNYYLQNKSSKKMISNVGDNQAFKVEAETKANAIKWQVKAGDDATFYIENVANSNKCINETPSWNGIISWDETEGSRWYITCVDSVAAYTEEDINNLIGQTNDLVDRVCNYSEDPVQVALQGSDETAAYYISTNYPDEAYPISNLIDNKRATNWYSSSTATANSYHCLIIDLGENNTAQNVKFWYRTSTKKDTNSPTTILVQRSANNKTWNTQETLSDLPAGKTTVSEYESPLISATKGFRYWRLQVTSTSNTDAGTKPYFGMNDLKFYTVDKTVEWKTGYEALSTTLVTNAKTAVTDAEQALQGVTTPLNNYSSYNALYTKYKKLYDAAEAAVPTSIGDVPTAVDATRISNGIYTLDGRQVSNTNKSGIYIINGKKVLK